MPDALADRYVLGDELGRGGMARVVAARDLRLDRTVAVKLLVAGPDPTARHRFVREARAAAAFAHPHAVSIFDAGEVGGELYLVMELVDGESLAALLARRGPLPTEEAIGIADQVLQALAAAHRAGVVHRDVKPGNVLVTAGGVAKLADFGIAKRLHDAAGDLTMTGQFVGTPTYLAPEQVSGRPSTAATDLYSTGVLLFEMLGGRPPFAGDTPVATAIAHRDEPVPDLRALRPDVPGHVADAVRRAMAKAPADRFADADAMRRALAVEPTLGPLSALPATEVMPTPPTGQHRRWWWLAVGAAIAVLVLGAALALADGDDPPGGAADPTAAPVVATTSPGTTAPVATTTPPTPAPTAAPTTPTTPTTPAELAALIAADPAAFGPHADSIRRDLERIGDGDERRAERLLDRVDGWTEDGTLSPEAAAMIEAVLPAGDEGDRGGDGDDD